MDDRLGTHEFQFSMSSIRSKTEDGNAETAIWFQFSMSPIRSDVFHICEQEHYRVSILHESD